MKPAGWPRYMREKPLKGGGVAYFWEPPRLFLTQGFTGHVEALGRDYAAARARAELLTAHLDAWRTGRNSVIIEEERTSFGTISWAFDRYLKSSPFETRVF